jgi:hypothetical protein
VLVLSKNPKRQANINAKRFNQLMRDIEKDVGRRTINAKDTDDWMNKLGMYANRNPFTVGGVKHDETVKILNNIMDSAKFKGLTRGGTQELVKGVIAENTMHYVTRMGDDMKNQLRKIAIDGYNQKLAPRELAKKLQAEVQGLSKTRAMAIARTETMRASNLANYVNAKLNMGAKSYKVNSAHDCCPKCVEIFKHGSQWFDIDDLTYFPPIHPHCGCVPAYSTKTADENNGFSDLDSLEKEYPLNHNISYIEESNIRVFTGEDSTVINNAIMAKFRGGNYSPREYDIGQNINRTILNKGHKLKKDTTLWRGEDDLYIGTPRVGEVHIWNKLTSTSFDKKTAQDFQRNNGWLYEIQAPKNTKGLYVEELTANMNEYEYLLGIGTRFRILEIDEVNKYMKLLLIL